MGVFFQELSKRLAEKWLTLLVLPGLLWVATAAVSVVVRHTGLTDVAGLIRQLNLFATDLAAESPVQIGLVAVVAIGASAAAGLLATGCGRLVQRWWGGQWPGWLGWLAMPLTARRRRRWQQAQDSLDAEVERGRRAGRPDQRALDQLAARCNRIALAEPTRPTWIGDRVAAVDARVRAEYDLDLAPAWPRLWLIVPDHVRTELQSAATGFDKAAILGGWALLYLMVGAVSWPAALLGLVTGVVAWQRGRETIALLCDLAEATVDLYGADLAQQLGLSPDGSLTEQVGRRVTARLRKGA